jgi:hypothetical protein
MAHFAKLNENNVVIDIVVVNNKDILDHEGNENEGLGINFLRQVTGHLYWKQTSYNAKFRKRYAGVGFTYNPTHNAFIPPKYFESWVWNEECLCWQPPVPIPDHEQNKKAIWNESIANWELVDL